MEQKTSVRAQRMKDVVRTFPVAVASEQICGHYTSLHFLMQWCVDHVLQTWQVW